MLRTEKIENAAQRNRDELVRFGTALLFIVGIMLFTIVRTDGGIDGTLLVAAAMIGGYMAMNIGANDVANNVGPAVGSHAITLTGAIFIAAFFEASGALVAGGDVVGTIKSGIIDPDLVADRDTFIWIMIAALLAAAVWLNFATAIGAPVSTTHSIVGGVLGGGVAAAGWGIADWSVVGQIAASWVISPVLGGLIAAGFLFLIKRTITYKQDVLEAANRMVPVLVALMAWAFATYLMLKGVKKVIAVSFPMALLIGIVAVNVVAVHYGTQASRNQSAIQELERESSILRSAGVEAISMPTVSLPGMGARILIFSARVARAMSFSRLTMRSTRTPRAG